MPEGPELHLASRFINNVCRGRVFGKILKSDISKNPVVQPPADRYIISSTSRGKEIKITLTEFLTSCDDCKESLKKATVAKPRSLDILFTFGLAGKFDFYEASELQKHAHLNFFTCDSGPKMVLSFVDYMRFGKWTPAADFSKDRGPCVLFDYNNFRENVLQRLDNAVFKKPICEVLLDQKYFNGIGNYLRAEILHRAKVPPFVSARNVLEPLLETGEGKVKSETPDILQLCNLLPLEVVNLESSWYDGKDRSDVSNAFNAWLQCYYQDGMKNIADHNKRTIWYSGPLGPLAPKDIHVRGKKRSKSKKISSDGEEKTEQVNKKAATKGRQLTEDENDNIDSDSLPSDVKKAKLTKSAKAKLTKKVEETDGIDEEVAFIKSITANTADKLKKKRKKPAKQKSAVSDLNENQTRDVKDKIQTGRLTRGKIREIVDAIEEMSEKKTKGNKRKVAAKKSKMEPMSVDIMEEVKNEVEDMSEAVIKVSTRKVAKKVSVTRKTKGIKEDKTVDKEIRANGESLRENLSDGTIKMSARTKAKARSGKQVKITTANDQTAFHESKKTTQKMKLKTPKKRSIRRLSSS